MADQLDDDRDEEWFKEVYGTEYTGPPKAPRGGDTRREVAPAAKASNKRLSTNVSDSEDEDEPRDPNAVPTDFTSREAKVWEAKAKAVERNWKRRKEEELTCHLCGEVGHFSQGCPTTLGGNRKSGEVVERIPLRDKRLKPRIIGTGGAIIQGIEKDTNCRLKLEDNLTAGPGAFFVKITGPDRMTVIKAVNAVRKLVDQVEEEWKQQPVGWKAQGAERGSRGGAPAVNPLITAQMQHIAVQRLQHVNPGSGRTESAPPVDEEKRTIEHIASQLEARRQWEAVSGSSQHSLNGSYTEGRTASGAGSMSASLAVKGPGPIDGGSTFYPDNAGLYPNQAEQGMELELEYDEHSLDELERRFLEETIELTKDQNKEEDKENARHRKILREIQEQYQQKMTQLRAKQAKQREDFLRHEAHMRYQQPPSTGYGLYPYARSVPPYDDSLPPYDMTYEQQIPTDTTHGHPLVYESYSDAGGASYNRKQGYDGSKVHSKNQVYETSSHPYGGSPPYPAYG